VTIFARYIDRLSIWCVQLPRLLRAGFEWWVAGLLLPLPQRWRSRLERPEEIVTARADGAYGIAVVHTGQAGRRETSVAADTGFASVAAELSLPPNARVLLALDAASCLRRRLALPAAAARVLRDVLRNEIERLTPIPADDLRFEYRVARFEPAQKRLLVDVFVTRASGVDALRQRFADLGWPVHAISAGCGEVDAEVNFLRHADRASRGRGARLIPRWSVAVCGVALACLLFLPALRYEALLGAAAREIDGVRAAALARREAIAQRDALLARERFLDERRAGYVPVLNALTELTTIIPEPTWLQQLDLRGAALQMQGESNSAASLLQAIEDDALFADAAFAAPISPLPGENKERFVVIARVEVPSP
jgi:general secretion pathway protein L